MWSRFDARLNRQLLGLFLFFAGRARSPYGDRNNDEPFGLGIFEPQHQRKRCLMRPGRRHPPSCWVALAAYGQKQVDHKKPGFTLLLFINDLAGGGCALQNVRGCAL